MTESRIETETPHTKADLVRQARLLGFDAIGVTDVRRHNETANRLAAFLADGRHGDMDWMATSADRRADPSVLWPQAHSAILVGFSYAPDQDPMAALAVRDHAVISVYAKGRDYHDVLKSRLKELARWFATATGGDVKVFVDTAPLMEKPLAAAAGLGWQGKHTNLVSRTHGSWLFLGAILTTVALDPDTPEDDHCGSCQRCLDVCPTNAFPAPYQLDARRCLAYLSIEHKGHIPTAFREAMGNRVFGCDDCLAICPWNKFAEQTREAKFAASAMTDNPPLAEILVLDDAAFRVRFAGTPIKRTGRDRIVRNALIAAGNSKDDNLQPLVERLLNDASPVVRAAAIWATSRLASVETFARLRLRHHTGETDRDVAAEWRCETGN